MELTNTQTDGLVYFTNFTDEDFTAKWDNVAYTFPANSTSPIIIPTETLAGIKNIRVKFARELAEKVFFGSETFLKRQAQGKDGLPPPVFIERDMASVIQRCLEPLPVKKAESVQVARKGVRLNTNEKGKEVTKVVDQDESLVGEGAVIA